MAKKIDSEVTSDDILGKDALDSEGEILGVILKLHIDRDKKSLTGITVDQGLTKPNLFVGIQFVKNIGVDSVFLDYIPYTKYKGMKVITHEGDMFGTVVDVTVSDRNLESITVSKKARLNSEKYIIRASSIKSISTQILLRKGAAVNKLEK